MMVYTAPHPLRHDAFDRLMRHETNVADAKSHLSHQQRRILSTQRKLSSLYKLYRRNAACQMPPSTCGFFMPTLTAASA
jgi:hypothetical protein